MVSTDGQTYFYPRFSNHHHQFRVRKTPKQLRSNSRTREARHSAKPKRDWDPRFGSKRERRGANRLG